MIENFYFFSFFFIRTFMTDSQEEICIHTQKDESWVSLFQQVNLVTAQIPHTDAHVTATVYCSIN